MSTLGFIWNIGAPEALIILTIGLLVFGRRLPEVGRGLGKSIVEFKRGLKGIEDDIETASNAPARPMQMQTAGAGAAEAPALQPPRPAATVAPPSTGGQDVRVSRSDTVD